MPFVGLSDKYRLIVLQVERSGLLKFISQKYRLFPALRVHVQVFFQTYELFFVQVCGAELGCFSLLGAIFSYNPPISQIFLDFLSQLSSCGFNSITMSIWEMGNRFNSHSMVLLISIILVSFSFNFFNILPHLHYLPLLRFYGICHLSSDIIRYSFQFLFLFIDHVLATLHFVSFPLSDFF